MDIEISLGEHKTVSSSAIRPGAHTFPMMARLNNGTLLLCFTVGPDVDYTPHGFLRSTDGGQTWQSCPKRTRTETSIGQLADGTVIALNMYTESTDRKGHMVGTMFRSTNGGKTFVGPIQVPVDIGREVWHPYPNHDLTGFVFWRSILELDNGDLLASMYGWFKDDEKFSSIMVKSIDRGASWVYLSIIAYNEQLGEQGDGPCEPVMAKLPNGQILAMLRVQGSATLYQCRSLDYGVTWSEPQAINAGRVNPDLVILHDGTLACSYGRPGNWIMFSLDNGETWIKHTSVFEGVSTGYTSIREIEPGKILMVYDAQKFDDGSGKGIADCLRSVLITVRNEKKN